MEELFDCIVIGGGHNGLTTAAYLARAGLSVLVLERRPLVGGGAMTEELTLPGFLHNTHSFLHFMIFVGPVFTDLELARHGADYVQPEVPASIVFQDGSSLTWHRDLDLFCKEIGKFSQKDAATYRDLYATWKGRAALLKGYLFNQPLPPSKLYALFEQTHEGREFLHMFLTSTDEFLKDHFESEQLRTLFALFATQTGTLFMGMGTGAFLPIMISEIGNLQIAKGGSITLARSLVRAIEAHGGVVLSDCHVRRILLEGGRAVGVELADGRRFTARQAVVSNVEPKQTLLSMVGREHLAAPFIRQVERWRPTKTALFTTHFAFNEALRWKAAARNPAVDRSLMLFLCEETGVLRRQEADIIEGMPPREPGFLYCAPTLYDPSQAPPGKHTGFFWQYACYDLRDGGPQRWNDIKEAYADTCCAHLAKYATNFTPQNVLARYVDTPLGIEERNISMIGGDFNAGACDQDQLGIFRPFHGCPPYHSPIERLFLCGPSTHPRGGVSAAPGFNAANAVAEALGVKKWWQKG
ncbi:MAG: NAD(P)/FAD-dependent oxidoreductase [Candidatus Tectomicrobia bacterium]|nr:NAD(P)/FAD-dependent oxidoreductase [Candidatus Tectomicrobia bacterium]